MGQETADNRAVIENTVTAYQKAIGLHSQLYRGAIYEFYDVRSVSGPYFKDSIQLVNGSVTYYGISYKNIPLIYDLNLQQVVTFLYDNSTKFAFLSEGLSAFDLYGHHFINFVPDEQNKKMDAGFYDELYNNKLQLLVKRSKSGQFESLTGKRVYYSKNIYYIKKGATYYNVSTKGQVLKLLGDKRKELKKYLKETGIDYADNKEQAMVMLLTYYDRITN
ncbi:hypothetical protein GCM10027049_03920 [Mucilaginibacter puniceus]